MPNPFQKIRQEIIDHPMDAWAKALGYRPVYTASATARILVVGQAPGHKAQDSDTPWNDVSGDNLRRWLGIGRETFYSPELIALMPMDFYYPGKGRSGDLPPRKEFAPAWHPRLLALMPEVRLTILVGQYAQKYYLGERFKGSLTETIRAFEEYAPKYAPLVHPSPLTFRWQTSNPWFQEMVIPRLRQLVANALANTA